MKDLVIDGADADCVRIFDRKSDKSFKGNYLGNGKILRITYSNGDADSVFPVMEGSVVQDLMIDAHVSTDSDKEVGVLSLQINDSFIRNVMLTGAVNATKAQTVGGLVGEMVNSRLEDVMAGVLKKGKELVGYGLVVTGGNQGNLGGIVGVASDSTLQGVKAPHGITVEGGLRRIMLVDCWVMETVLR